MLGKNPYAYVTREAWDSRILSRNIEYSIEIFIDEHGQEYEITQEDYYADDWVVLPPRYTKHTDSHKFRRM